MSAAVARPATIQQERPVGLIGPSHDAAQRADRALHEHRLDDAAHHIRRLPDTSLLERFWKTLLRGGERAERHELSEAEALTWQALGIASAMTHLGDHAPETARLTARALHQLGRLIRRQDRAKDALALHRAAHRLRRADGSVEETWESLIELGLDADLDGQTDDAIDWFHQAIETGAAAQAEPGVKQATGWTHVSRVCSANARHPQAVEAARTAQTLWHAHDTGGARAAQADVRLGSVLLNRIVALRESDQAGDTDALNEAAALLESAAESLAAFGAAYDADMRWAREQYNFAKQLRIDTG